MAQAVNKLAAVEAEGPEWRSSVERGVGKGFTHNATYCDIGGAVLNADEEVL